jgi:hypothetical protein
MIALFNFKMISERIDIKIYILKGYNCRKMYLFP